MFKPKVFYHILWADLLIVLILVGMMIPLCYQMVTTIRERELNDSYNTMLNCIDVLDNQIKSLENILTKAYVNENLVRISIIDGEMQTSDYYALLKAQQHISAIASSNSYVTDIIVVFKSNDVSNINNDVMCDNHLFFKKS
jgi:predicted membrane-bound spermidine synthase